MTMPDTLSPACRVLLVSAIGTRTNPYIGLLEAGLAAAGIAVKRVERLDSADLAAARRPDVIHLHWLDHYDRPPAILCRPLHGATDLPRRLMRRGVEALANHPAVYALRRWRRLRHLFGQLRHFQAAGGRVVYTVHNLQAHEEEGIVDRWGTRRLIGLADIVHVHEAATGRELATQFGCRAEIVVIPHGHYIDCYPNTIDRDEARRRLGLPGASFVYLTLGLLRPYKGLEELVPAFRALADQDAVLVLAGKPTPPAFAHVLADLAATDPRIRLVPQFIPPAELQVYLNAADICVLPYRKITTSGAALLAFSFGAPIIAPAVGSFSELVTPERGLLYEPDQAGALINALACAKAKDWLSLRPQIRQWAAQFDWQHIGEQWLQVYTRPTAPRRS